MTETLHQLGRRGRLTAELIAASQPLLEQIPYPVMWIDAHYQVTWVNAAAREHYATTTGACHAISHGYQSPCDHHDEACPKRRAEETGSPVSVNHVHNTRHGMELFVVTAVPVAGGGVLELHVPLEDVLARDKLTGLYTRDFFARLVDRQLGLLRRIDAPYALIMIDLDHFKRINDTGGHALGDEALAAVGAAIEADTRNADTAGRWGGEEFCVFLPATDRRGARVRAERLLSAIRMIELSTGDRFTASAGVACGAADVPFDEMLERSDAALYEAKRTGRDRLVEAE